MVVVDNLNERLDASAALNELGAHATGDLPGVTLDTGDKGVGEGVRLGAIVIRLDNDGLLTSVTATGDDGHTAHFHELHCESPGERQQGRWGCCRSASVVEEDVFFRL